MNLEDGSILPVAPGVSGGVYDSSKYKPINFTINEVIQDLKLFVANVKNINPKIRFLFTVSPVSLMATHQDRHVVLSTSDSKSVLRVACSELVRLHPEFIEYFPSYEIITSTHSRGKYFEADCRSVNEVGVSHVMRVFEKHYLNKSSYQPEIQSNLSNVQDIICDEELIEESIKKSGFGS
jgi:hypothetical protein